LFTEIKTGDGNEMAGGRNRMGVDRSEIADGGEKIGQEWPTMKWWRAGIK
jgi:hypothetical protein